jgi:hypothetical protein
MLKLLLLAMFSGGPLAGVLYYVYLVSIEITTYVCCTICKHLDYKLDMNLYVNSTSIL